MKLLFWKPKPAQDQERSYSAEIRSKGDYVRDYLNGGPIVNKPGESSSGAPRVGDRRVNHTGRQPALNHSQPTTTREPRVNKAVDQVLHTRRYKMLAIKNWCERKLTPVAYARVLVRILPVLREYGYNFREMQYPTPETRINHDFFIVIRATIKEIYDEEYRRLETTEA